MRLFFLSLFFPHKFGISRILRDAGREVSGRRRAISVKQWRTFNVYTTQQALAPSRSRRPLLFSFLCTTCGGGFWTGWAVRGALMRLFPPRLIPY